MLYVNYVLQYVIINLEIYTTENYIQQTLKKSTLKDWTATLSSSMLTQLTKSLFAIDDAKQQSRPPGRLEIKGSKRVSQK